MDMENRLVVAKVEEEGVGWTGSLFCRCKLLDLEWISNEVLLGVAQETISNHSWKII